jgi:hypothetical protein
VIVMSRVALVPLHYRLRPPPSGGRRFRHPCRVRSVWPAREPDWGRVSVFARKACSSVGDLPHERQDGPAVSTPASSDEGQLARHPDRVHLSLYSHTPSDTWSKADDLQTLVAHPDVEMQRTREADIGAATTCPSGSGMGLTLASVRSV